jgi:pyroglutamyl-peptidase
MGASARQLTLLVTGFGPFPNYPENPSGDIAEAVHGRQIGEVRVLGRQVSVSWIEAWQSVAAAVQEYRPDALLCLGVAPDPFIRLEIFAKNIALPSLDAVGRMPQVFPLWRLVENAPPAYWTTLPVDWLGERLRERRDGLIARGTTGTVVHGERWPDAGYYLCNAVFFQAMHFLKDQVPYRGFIHVPRYTPADGIAGVPRHEVLASGIYLVEELARWLIRKTQGALSDA